MKPDIGNIYQRLFDAYKKSHSTKSAGKAQEEVVIIWKDLKDKYKLQDDLVKKAEELISDYLNLSQKNKCNNILKFFTTQTSKSSALANQSQPSSSASNVESLTVSSLSPILTESSDHLKSISREDGKLYDEEISEASHLSTSKKRKIEVLDITNDEEDLEHAVIALTPKRDTPAQTAQISKIHVLESELNSAVTRRDAGLGDNLTEQRIKKLRETLECENKTLDKLKRNADRQKEFRQTRKKNLDKLQKNDKNIAKLLGIRDEPGRPRLETEQPELLNAITQIALHGGSADSRRRSETIRTCKTLSQLQAHLLEKGITISRSATYLRLLPRNSATNEGKKHIQTVPVKLSRPQTDLHKSHVDQHFCKATINCIETLASTLSPEEVAFLSQDDKARVPLGKTAAKLQAPIIMHLEYRVQLPDHDWVVAGGHKLIPSVYAGIVIKDGPIGKKTNVSYSGPTYIAIRSAKHNSSTASTHAFDLKRLLELESFNTIMRNSNGSIKPVLILSVDGGPDENPRYEKVIAHAINHFKEFDLDGIFIFTNAPNRSAFNRVERRMAPLSRELTGVILPHDKFGKHLGDNGETIDSQLELENFEHAGNILSDIWSNTKIDGFEVFAEYISPSLNENLESPEVPSPTWYCKHVFESQYFLQIIKCDNVSCCQPLRSDLKKVLIFGRLPPPIPLLRDQSGLRIPSPNEGILTTFASLLQRHSLDLKPNHDGFLIMPYDMYCPSVQSDLLNRTCKYCGFYTATKKSAQKHKKSLHPYGVLETSRIRPLCVVARRAREALCYVTHISGEEAEWIDIEDIDEQFINNETESSQTSKELPIPVVTSFENWLQNPFIEDCDYTIEDNMRY